MIEVNKNMLASAIPALGKLFCRTSPLALCKSMDEVDELAKATDASEKTDDAVFIVTASW